MAHWLDSSEEIDTHGMELAFRNTEFRPYNAQSGDTVTDNFLDGEEQVVRLVLLVVKVSDFPGLKEMVCRTKLNNRNHVALMRLHDENPKEDVVFLAQERQMTAVENLA